MYFDIYKYSIIELLAFDTSTQKKRPVRKTYKKQLKLGMRSAQCVLHRFNP